MFNRAIRFFAVMAIGLFSLSYTPVLSQTKPAAKQFPGYLKIYQMSQEDVIKTLGQPTLQWREKDFDTSVPDGYKDHLIYANIAGSRYVDIPIYQGKVYDIEAVYVNVPTNKQLVELLGVTSPLSVNVEGKGADKVRHFTSPQLKSTFPQKEGSKPQYSGLIFPVPAEMLDNSPFGENLKKFHAKKGDSYVSFPG